MKNASIGWTDLPKTEGGGGLPPYSGNPVLNYMYIFLIGNDHNRRSGLVKVHIFWEGHKFLRNLHLTFLSYVVPVKSKVEISQNFVAFSQHINFTNIPIKF